MQSEHYQALKNPLYVADAMADIMREELSMSMPYGNFTQSPESTTMPVQEPDWLKKLWDEFQQTRAERLHYRQEIAEYMAKVDKLVKAEETRNSESL